MTLQSEEACNLPLLTELWLTAEELLFDLGAGCNRTKGGVALDNVESGQLPIIPLQYFLEIRRTEAKYLPGWTTRQAVGF